MVKFNQLNADVLFEITNYLHNTDRLALALSYRHAFHFSSSSTYWHPEAFTDTNIIYPPFLPTRITSWFGYTGDDYRLGAQRMLAFRRNWVSDQPRATSFKRLGKAGCFLIAVPGSRWVIFGLTDADHNLSFDLVDTMTGRRADGIVIPGWKLTNKWQLPLACACDSNELLLGHHVLCGPEADVNSPTFPHRHEVNLDVGFNPPKRQYQIYRFILTESETDKTQVRATVTPLHLFDGLSIVTEWVLRRSFCVFYATRPCSFGVIDLKSGQLWVWRTKKAILCVEMTDNLLIILLKFTSFEIMAVNLSVLRSRYPRFSGDSTYQLGAPEISKAITFDQIPSFSRCAQELNTSIARAQTGPEKDTFLLMCNIVSKCWALRFHISPRNDLYGLIELVPSDSECHSSAHRMRKEVEYKKYFLTAPRFEDVDVCKFGLQLAITRYIEDSWRTVIQIVGYDDPEEGHELDMSFARNGGKNLVLDEESLKRVSYPITKYIDGDTGMVIVSCALSREIADYAVYWF